MRKQERVELNEQVRRLERDISVTFLAGCRHRNANLSLQTTSPSDALGLGASSVHYAAPQPPPSQISMPLLFFNKALPDQMLTPCNDRTACRGNKQQIPF